MPHAGTPHAWLLCAWCLLLGPARAGSTTPAAPDAKTAAADTSSRKTRYEETWEIGAPGASCDDVCRGHSRQCDEGRFPSNEEQFNANVTCGFTFDGNVFEAPAVLSTTQSADSPLTVQDLKADGKSLCAWQAPQRVWGRGIYSTFARCGRKASLKYRRICPCAGLLTDDDGGDAELLGGGVYSYKKYETYSGVAARNLLPPLVDQYERQFPDRPLIMSGQQDRSKKSAEDLDDFWFFPSSEMHSFYAGVQDLATESTTMVDQYRSHVEGATQFYQTRGFVHDTCLHRVPLTAEFLDTARNISGPVDFTAATDLEMIVVVTDANGSTIHTWGTGPLHCLPYQEGVFPVFRAPLAAYEQAMLVGPNFRTGTLIVPLPQAPKVNETIAPGDVVEPFTQRTTWGNYTALPGMGRPGKRVHSVTTNYGAAAVLYADGTVEAFGEASAGGQVPAGLAPLSSIVQVFASRGAFAAVREDGDVVVWGSAELGGDYEAFQAGLVASNAHLGDAVTVVATEASFAILALQPGKTLEKAAEARPVFPGVVHVTGSVDHGGGFYKEYYTAGSVGFDACAKDLDDNTRGVEGAVYVSSSVACAAAAAQLQKEGKVVNVQPVEENVAGRPQGCYVDGGGSADAVVRYNRLPDATVPCFWEEEERGGFSGRYGWNWYREDFVSNLAECRAACCADTLCGAATLVEDALPRNLTTCRRYRQGTYEVIATATATETATFTTPSVSLTTTATDTESLYGMGATPTLTLHSTPTPTLRTPTVSPTLNGPVNDTGADVNETVVPTATLTAPLPPAFVPNPVYTSFAKVPNLRRVCHKTDKLRTSLHLVGNTDDYGFSSVYASRRGFMALRSSPRAPSQLLQWPYSGASDTPVLPAYSKLQAVPQVYSMEEAFVVVNTNTAVVPPSTDVSTLFSAGADGSFYINKMTPPATVTHSDRVKQMAFTNSSAAVLWADGNVDAWQVKPLALELFVEFKEVACHWLTPPDPKGNWTLHGRMTRLACAQRCLETPACTGFEYPKDGAYCAPWLNGACSQTFQPADQTFRPVTVLHSRDSDLYILQELVLQLQTKDFAALNFTMIGVGNCMSLGKRYPPFYSFGKSTLQACRDACLADAECTGFEHDEADGRTCTLMREIVDATKPAAAGKMPYCYQRNNESFLPHNSYSQMEGFTAGNSTVDAPVTANDTVEVSRDNPANWWEGNSRLGLNAAFSDYPELYNMIVPCLSDPELTHDDEECAWLSITTVLDSDPAYDPKKIEAKVLCGIDPNSTAPPSERRGLNADLIGRQNTHLCPPQEGDEAHKRGTLLEPRMAIVKGLVGRSVDGGKTQAFARIQEILRTNPGWIRNNCGVLLFSNSRCGQQVPADLTKWYTSNAWWQVTEDYTCPLKNLEPVVDYTMMPADGGITTAMECAAQCALLRPNKALCTSFVFPYVQAGDDDRCLLLHDSVCRNPLSATNLKGYVRATAGKWYILQNNELARPAIDVRMQPLYFGATREEGLAKLDMETHHAALFKALAPYKLAPLQNGTEYRLERIESGNTLFAAVVVNKTMEAQMEAQKGSSNFLSHRSLVIPGDRSTANQLNEYERTQPLSKGVNAYLDYVGEATFPKAGVGRVLMGLVSVSALRYGLDHDECNSNPCAASTVGSKQTTEEAVHCIDKNAASWSNNNYVCVCRFAVGEVLAGPAVCEPPVVVGLLYAIPLVCLVVAALVQMVILMKKSNFRKEKERAYSRSLKQLYSLHATEDERQALNDMLDNNPGNELALLRVIVPQFHVRMCEARVFLLWQRRIEQMPLWQSLCNDLAKRVQEMIFGLDVLQRTATRPATPFGFLVRRAITTNQRRGQGEKEEAAAAPLSSSNNNPVEAYSSRLWSSDLGLPLVPNSEHTRVVC
eukprot:Rhum_TRINITY_DN14252_c6_g1::Rhum_TRINITY_DN14252_c6_g1_i1::g.75500::m.75500